MKEMQVTLNHKKHTPPLSSTNPYPPHNLIPLTLVIHPTPPLFLATLNNQISPPPFFPIPKRDQIPVSSPRPTFAVFTHKQSLLANQGEQEEGRERCGVDGR